MHNFPLASLSTLITLAVYFWTSILVARARKKFGIDAPAITGNEMFERCFRVQMNTLEQLALMLPTLWLCAVWVGDIYAAAGGLVWSAGRVLYAVSYRQDPKTRGPGFGIGFGAVFLMSVAVVVAIVPGLI